MKKVIFVIIAWLLAINHIYAIHRDDIILWWNITISNTEENIDNAKLIEKDTSEFKRKLEIIRDKYFLKEDKTIKKTIGEIQEIIYTLRKVQTTKVEKSIADTVIRENIDKLKEINSNLKPYLRKIKIDFENKKLQYFGIASKLENSLDKIIDWIYKKYWNKNNLREKEEKMISLAYKLKKQKDKLWEFKKQNFNNKEELRLKLIEIVKNIRYLVKEIISLSKKL